MKRFLRFCRPFVHVLCVFAGCMSAVWLRQRSDFIPFIQLRIPSLSLDDMWMFSLIASFVFIGIGFARGLYELTKPLHGYTAKSLIVWVYWSVSVACIAFFGSGGVVSIFTNNISRLVVVWGCVLTLIYVVVTDLWINMMNAHIERRYPYRICALYEHLEFYDHVSRVLRTYAIYHVDGIQYISGGDVAKIIQSYDIVLLVGRYTTQTIQEVSDIARGGDKMIYHIPEGAFAEDLLYRPERLGPIMGFAYTPSPLEGRGRVVKRMGDITFAVCFLVCFGWVYICLALFIWLCDGSPVIYVSQRVGKGGRPIAVYKFRSMIKHADKQKKHLTSVNEREGPLFKITNDPRVPGWGKRLRRLSLDELPQMRNILCGDMSLVGPRPHLPVEVAQYTGRQKRLLSIKPGLTGYAQIFGRDSLSFDEEARLDLYYIQNWNVFLDLYVIISTLKVVTKGS